MRVEQFTVPSWSDYRRQTTERWTDSDHHLITAALSHTETRATESEQQLFALRSPRSDRPRPTTTKLPLAHSPADTAG